MLISSALVELSGLILIIKLDMKICEKEWGSEHNSTHCLYVWKFQKINENINTKLKSLMKALHS